MTYKKITAAILTLTLLLTIFSACNKKQGENADKPADGGDTINVAPIVLENAYTSKDIPISISDRGQWDIVAVNGSIYYTSSEIVTNTNENGDTTETGYITKIKCINLNGGDEKIIWEKEFVYSNSENDIYEYENLNAFSVDNAGNLWLFRTYDKFDQVSQRSESKITITKIAPDGTELLSTDISKVAGENEYFYPNGIYFNKDGDICTYSNQSIYVFDGETAELDFKISEQSYIYGICSTNTGDVIYITQPQRTYEIKKIDFAAKTGGVAQSYTGNIYFNNIASGTGDYSFFTMQNDYIYGFKLDSMTAEIVVNFANSDIDNSHINKIISMANGEFVAFVYDWNTRESYITHLIPNPDAVVEGKVLITLGAVYLDPATKSTIRQFNKNSSTARINVIDYSQYNTTENYSAGIAQLDMDILAGRAPDIICFSGLQPAKYAAKGILEDMLPYLENDTDINRENLFENILNAGIYDGKLYRLITAYSISTLVGKTSITGEPGSFTSSKINEIASKYPDSELVLTTTASSWISNCISMSLNEYVDWSTGKCNFNTPEFIDLLNSSKHFPAEIDYDALYNDYDAYQQNLKTTFKENKTIFMYSGMNRIRELRSTAEAFGEDVSFVGFPTQSGGGALIYPAQDYGISSASKYKDEAWGFIRMFLNDEVDSGDMWTQSISRTSFEKQASDEMIPLAERDFSKGVEISEFFPGGGASTWTVNSLSEINLNDYVGYELTQKEVDTARKIIESATMVYASDEMISKIISEEIEAFIKGSKSASDVAQIIQSRVSIYVSEIM